MKCFCAAAITALVLIAALPAGAGTVAPLTIHRAPANTAAGNMAGLAAARASDAVGNPYVSPKPGNGLRSAQNSASANANAATERTTNTGTAP